jgi:hypothetical protein
MAPLYALLAVYQGGRAVTERWPGSVWPAVTTRTTRQLGTFGDILMTTGALLPYKETAETGDKETVPAKPFPHY